MKKFFSIILYVLLGIIILPILYLIFVSLLDTFYEAGSYPGNINIAISTALSIILSIIIPIRRYKRAKANKNKKRSIKDQKNMDIKKEFFRNIVLLIFVPIVLVLGLFIWFSSGDDPEAPKTTSIYDQRFLKCYGEMTVSHKARGLHQSNRELSIRIKDGICKAYAEGEELNYEGKQ